VNNIVAAFVRVLNYLKLFGFSGIADINRRAFMRSCKINVCKHAVVGNSVNGKTVADNAVIAVNRK